MSIQKDVATKSERGMLLLALSILALLTVVAIVSRPLTPIDETRYISVAWEMWLRGDLLVPFKNGAPYSHKPPLMMWLYQAGWAVFGVNEWWPRLVHPLVSAGNLLLMIGLSKRLWPDRPDIGGPAALILVSSLLWTIFSTSAMFDVILAFFTLLGMYGTLVAADGERRRGMVWLGVAIGLGVLAKGPVILLHVLPVAVLAPWWKPGLRRAHWYGGIFLAVLLGAGIALLWAIPAGMSGGEEYRKAIFWGQTADRMVESFAHRRPMWWYLPLLPVIFFPWFIWPGLWRTLRRFIGRDIDRGGRFCLAWMLPVFVAFSLISGKQPHYLIPIFPAFALLAARSLVAEERIKGLWMPTLAALSIGVAFLVMAKGGLGPKVGDQKMFTEMWPGLLMITAVVLLYLFGRHTANPIPALALLGAGVSALGQLALARPLYPAYDVRPIAIAIHDAQANGHLVAHLGEYHNQYHFAGRLQSPLPLFDDAEPLKAWLIDHPEAYVVLYPKSTRSLAGIEVIATQSYLGGAVALLAAQPALSVLSTQESIDSRLD